jgi:hypothetical protein
MAFRIDDLTLQLMPTNGGQPGGCTCGPASGAVNRPPCAASGKPGDGGGGGKPTKPSGTPKKRAPYALREQLRETLAPSM